MGRGSDTRMYNPRSESSHMFRENHEEEGTRTGYEDPRDLDNRADKRQAKKEKEDKEDRKIKHIKVRRHHLRSGQDEIDEEEGRDDSTKLDADREVGLQTNPAGTGGFLTSLATQAKGPGAAAGQLVAMSEPMENAWSELLKASVSGSRLPEDTQLHELGQTDLIRLLQHPNERIAAFASRELQLRAMETHGSVPFLDSASEKEIAEFFEPQFQSLPYEYGNVQPSDVKNFGIPAREYYAERAGDVTEAIPGGMFQILGAREKYDHLKETAPQHLVDDYVQRINNYYQGITNPTYLPFFDLESPAEYTPSQTPESIEDMMDAVDDAGTMLGKHPATVAENATGFEHRFQQKNASEPMEHAWSELLKMTEAEMLDYYSPENMIQRERARLHRGGWDGGRKNMPKGRADEIMREEEARKDKMISAGVPPELVYAHHDYEPRIRAFSQVPPHLMGHLPVQNKLELIDSRELARRINMQPAELYHQRRMVQTMLPPPFDPPSESSQQDDIHHIGGMHFVNGVMMDDNQYNQYLEQSTAGSDIHFEQKNASEPMFIGDVLVKSKKDERKRKKEMRTHWRPSTGAFELPKGGSRPGTATSRRAKIISRNLPQGKKTGLGQAHLSVEMSHRGIASKQPKSKDPAEYTKFLAQQEARRRIGNVRTPYSQPRRFGQPSKRGFRLNMPRAPRPRLHPVRAPRITPPKMKMPRLHKPKMPGMVTMSEDEVTHSDVLKSASDAGYLRILVRELREALRDVRDKDRKSKGMGTPDTSGAGSNLPNHPSNSHAQTSAPQGGTENEDAEAKMYGADPAQVINARGSNKS